MFLRAGKFFNGRNEALKVNQSDAATSAGTFQTVRFDLAGFAEQIHLRPAQTGEWTKCAGLWKAHEAWLQMRTTRRRASVPPARVGRWRDAQKIFPFTIHTPQTLSKSVTGQAFQIHGASRAGDSIAEMESVLSMCPTASEM